MREKAWANMLETGLLFWIRLINPSSRLRVLYACDIKMNVFSRLACGMRYNFF